MVYICFDFGTHVWGCAVGDDVSQTANAIGGIKAVNGKPDWQKINEIVDQWQPEAIVIGYPLKANGERFKLTDRVDAAILDIKDHYPTLELITADERLSTVEARASLYAEKGYKGLEKANVDAESAKIILLNWFEHQALF